MKNEKTGKKVATTAARILAAQDIFCITWTKKAKADGWRVIPAAQIKAMAASLVTQRPDREPAVASGKNLKRLTPKRKRHSAS